MARASRAQGWSQIGADVDLVDAMKTALVVQKRTTSNKGQMHLVDGDEAKVKAGAGGRPEHTQCDSTAWMFEC